MLFLFFLFLIFSIDIKQHVLGARHFIAFSICPSDLFHKNMFEWCFNNFIFFSADTYNIKSACKKHFLGHALQSSGNRFFCKQSSNGQCCISVTNEENRCALTRWKPDTVRCIWGWTPGWTWLSGFSGWHDGNHSGQRRGNMLHRQVNGAIVLWI